MSYRSLRKALENPDFYSAVVVIDAMGKVLLGKRTEDKKWTTPAGGGHLPETPERAAVRELFEEAGIAAQEESLQPVHTQETGNGKKCHVFLLVVNPGLNTTSRLDPDQEVKLWNWYAMEDIPKDLADDERRHTGVRAAYMKFHGIEKGGEGSGVKGHRTYHENEKNHHYEEGLKIQAALQQVNDAVKKRKAMNPRYTIPEEAKEIIKELKGRLEGHKMQLSGHVNQLGRLDAADAKKVKKSVHQMDMHSGQAVDTGNFAQATEGAGRDWLEYFSNCMADFNYGDVPRDIILDRGYYISLVKTDDGIYSGRVRQTIQPGQNEALEENVFKIEKQTIPDMIQVLKAKEYISLVDVGVKYAQEMDKVGDELEQMEEAYFDKEPTMALSEYLKIMEERDLREMRMKLEVIRTLINV